jgi:glycosyltransferase involved in cell wall biosynthesis
VSGPRVLLLGRSDLVSKPGGDTRQILDLLRRLGGRGALSLELEPSLDGFDLVHVFNLSRPVEPALQSEHAARRGVPVVVTPIFQDLRDYNRRGRRGAGRALFALLGRDDVRLEDARALSNLLRSGAVEVARHPGLVLGLLSHAILSAPEAGSALALQKRILENSRAVVFNSGLEQKTLESCLDIFDLGSRGAVVPVGIDPNELAAEGVDRAAFTRRFGVRPGFVLEVGRIEDLKNQLGLIEALRAVPVDLVLIGDVNPLHRGYARTVHRAARSRPRTLVCSGLPRAMVLSALASASVHVLPSHFETAGLVSLEAAVSGCAVVSTDRGYARAYLGDEAAYCDSGDPASIRRAVLEALERGPSPSLRARVLREFTAELSWLAMDEVYGRAAAA